MGIIKLENKQQHHLNNTGNNNNNNNIYLLVGQILLIFETDLLFIL